MSSYLRTQLKIFLSLLGLMISCYAVYVEVSKHADPEFKAMCDFNEKSSCSRVLTSSYGTGMGLISVLLGEDHPLNISNSFYGIILYSLLALFSLFPLLDRTLVPLMVFVASCASLYLLYVLLYILEEICVVCMGIHVVNMCLFVLVLYSCACVKDDKTVSKKED